MINLDSLALLLEPSLPRIGGSPGVRAETRVRTRKHLRVASITDDELTSIGRLGALLRLF